MKVRQSNVIHGHIRHSTTYWDIQTWVKLRYGFVPKTCWIAHCKELFGLTVRVTWNRRVAVRLVPCPALKQPVIKQAFQHLGMLPYTD